MEERIFSLLQKVEQHSKNIEEKLFEQNDRINTIEKYLKINYNKQSGSESPATNLIDSSKNENFINQLKGEIDKIDCSKVEIRHGVRVKKSESLQEKRRPKLVKLRKSSHTVPSDKDEEMRINVFRRECLSQAIQWNLVDLIKAMPEDHDLVLPSWLSQKELKIVYEGKHSSQATGLRRLLCILMKKEFVAMQEWLNSCGLGSAVIRQVWQTFQEFSDEELNRTKMKCFRCKLVENIDIVHVVDYLFSASAIFEELYLKVFDTKQPVGTQQNLWNTVLKFCENNITEGSISHTTVILALKIALEDIIKDSRFDYGIVLETLLSDIEISMKEPSKLMSCFCKELCSKSFHPISCSLSLASLYFSPPAARRPSAREEISPPTSGKNAESLSSEDTPESNSFPFSSAGICNDRNISGKKSDTDEEQQPPKLPPGKRVSTNAGDFMFTSNDAHSAPIQRTRERRLRSKKSRKREMIAQSEPSRALVARSGSSLDSADGENNQETRILQNYRAKVSSSLHNKPQITIVNAKSVSIQSGPAPQYNFAKRSSEPLSSDSSGGSVLSTP